MQNKTKIEQLKAEIKKLEDEEKEQNKPLTRADLQNIIGDLKTSSIKAPSPNLKPSSNTSIFGTIPKKTCAAEKLGVLQIYEKTIIGSMGLFCGVLGFTIFNLYAGTLITGAGLIVGALMYRQNNAEIKRLKSEYGL